MQIPLRPTLQEQNDDFIFPPGSSVLSFVIITQTSYGLELTLCDGITFVFKIQNGDTAVIGCYKISLTKSFSK